MNQKLKTVVSCALVGALVSLGSHTRVFADTDPSVGTTHVVDQDGNGDFTTIQAAVNAASNTDCILIRPGTYFEEVDLGSKRLFLESEDILDDFTVATTVIHGSDTRATCMKTGNGVTQDSWVRGITFTHATDHGLQCGTEASPANVFVRRCRFIDNGSLTNGTDGAGLAYTTGRVLECSFRGNETEERGAGYFGESNSVEQCIFVGNEAADNGGALSGASKVDRSEFYDNVAENGGAIANSPGILITNSIFSKNVANNHGGAMYFCKSGTRVYNCTFVLNDADNKGGAMREVKGTGTKIKSNIFFFNTAGTSGDDTSDCSTRHYCFFETGNKPSNGNGNVQAASPLLVYLPLGGAESGEDGNYHIANSNSACIGNGRVLDGSNNDTPNDHDFDDDARPGSGGTWDIGADEF